MSEQSNDPSRLRGAALNDWYVRTFEDIEADAQAAEARRYEDFFRSPIDYGFASEDTRPEVAAAGPDDVLWVATGKGGYRRVGPASPFDALWPDDGNKFPPGLPRNPAEPETAELLWIGNPHNRRLKREWELKYGPWPHTPDGRPYDVAHIRAIADGGTNTLDNIRPMEPTEHRASHVEDSRRWGERPSRARAFGGTVEPPAHAAVRPRPGPVRGAVILDLLPNITGMLSGRIRTDSWDNFVSDMTGQQSQEDLDRANEELRRRYFPNAARGTLVT